MQEQDIQNKVNSEGQQDSVGWRSWPQFRLQAFLHYTLRQLHGIYGNFRLAELPLPYTGTSTDDQSVEWKDNKQMRCQDIPFLEKLAHAEPLWCHVTKEHQNAKIRHRDKFYKEINVNIVLCLNLNSHYSSFGLRIVLEHSNHELNRPGSTHL